MPRAALTERTMSGTEWLVVIGGVAAIAWVNWYFFLAGSAAGREGGKEER